MPARVPGDARILLLTQRVPYPPDRGDRIRAFHVLQFLAQRSRVYLGALSDEPVPAASREVLASLCERTCLVPLPRSLRNLRAIGSLAGGRSATEGFFRSPRLHRAVSDWAQEMPFDSVLAFCSSMGPYAASLVRRNVPLVVDLVDVDSQKWLDYAAAAKGWRRWLYRLEGRRVRALEQRLLHQARAALLVTEAEVGLFQAALPNQKTFAVPNGVDLDYFRPGNEPDEAENECVFTGVLNYPPNVDGLQWFCGEVWPLVRQRFPESRFRIVGRDPTLAVHRLGRLPGVAVVGEVPDVRPFLARAAVAVAPLRIARGIQNKVLEAMAMARPVIASPAALEGLEPAPGEAACRATTPSEWCARACELFGSPENRRRVGARARQFVEQHHSWEACLRPLEQILDLPAPATKTRKRDA